MSWYPVVCLKCNHTEPDFYKPMPKDWPVECPNCKQVELMWDCSAPMDFVLQDLTPKTAGQDAERNKKRWGKELTQIKAEQILGPKEMERRASPTPWWREDGSKPLDLTKVKDVQKYVHTGDKS